MSEIINLSGGNTDENPECGSDDEMIVFLEERILQKVIF